MTEWFDGVHLIDRYNPLLTGCWLLAHGGEAAVLEMPPALPFAAGCAGDAYRAASALGVRVRYLLCTHTHPDHFSPDVFDDMRRAFPDAEPVLQSGFKRRLGDRRGVRWFDAGERLWLSGEPLLLVHAPKHSMTDTVVVFRGSACTGDWELGTIRSVHDGRPWGVPDEVKRASVDKLARFEAESGYRVHRVYSVHANDRRDDVNFTALMAATHRDVKMW